MLYEFDLVVPANTAKASPAELVARLVPGTVTMVAVQYPAGVRGLVHTRVLRGGLQVWPTGADQTFKANNYVITWQEDYDLLDEPLEFVLQGWSPGTAFSHTITFRFALLPVVLKEERRGLAGIIRRLGEFMGVGV